MANNNQTFIYRGFHFTPVRKFRKNEAECARLRTDCVVAFRSEMGNWDYNDFYKKSRDSKMDIFICEETRRYYIPCEGGLCHYSNYQ